MPELDIDDVRASLEDAIGNLDRFTLCRGDLIDDQQGDWVYIDDVRALVGKVLETLEELMA